MDKILAIVSEDTVYAHTLSEYIKNSKTLNYRVLTFFDLTKFVEFKNKNQVSVSLIEEELSNGISNNNEELRLLLTKKRKDGACFIFKYQALDVLVKELGFKAHSTFDIGETPRIKCILVGGARGGSGVSSLGICIAGANASENNTLFLSLDPFLVLPEDMPCGKGDLSELIYTLKVKKDKYMSYAEKLIKHGKAFDYLVGVQCFEDLYSLGKEEMKNLFTGLGKSGRYDYLVVDIGKMPAGTEVLLDRCETLFLIGDEGESKTNLFIEELVRLMGEDVKEKISFAKLPIDDYFTTEKIVYNEIENTTMFSYSRKLVQERKKELDARNKLIGDSEYADNSAYLVEKRLRSVGEVMEAPAWNEKPLTTTKEKQKKGTFRRLLEKGLTEGLNG